MPLLSTSAIASRTTCVLVEHLFGFRRDQRLARVGDRQALRLGALALAEDVGEVDRADRGAGHVGQFEHRHARAALRQLDLDVLVVEFARAQLAAEGFARRRRRGRADQRVEHALLGGEFGLGLDVLALALL